MSVSPSHPSLKAILESLLLVADRPLGPKELSHLLPEFKTAEIQHALRDLQARYDDEKRGFELREVAGGFRLQTRESLREWVLRLKRIRPARLSKAALETLAVIAYKQPVSRAEVEEIRGVDASGTLRLLLDKKLVRIAGRKDAPGRPLLYGTTRRFLEVFDLKDLTTLPRPDEVSGLQCESGSQPELPLFPDRRRN
jgi:segregation and condensation protein B